MAIQGSTYTFPGNLNQNSAVVWTISVDEEKQSGDDFAQMVDCVLGKEEIVECHLLLTGELQRHNFLFKQGLENGFDQKAKVNTTYNGRTVNENWEKENTEAINKLKKKFGSNFHIIYWNEYLLDPNYSEALQQVKDYYVENSKFAETVRGRVAELLNKKYQIRTLNPEPTEYPDLFNYIFEECAALLLMYGQEKFIYELYAGKRSEPMWLAYKNLTPEGEKKFLKHIPFTRKRNSKEVSSMQLGGTAPDATQAQRDPSPARDSVQPTFESKRTDSPSRVSKSDETSETLDELDDTLNQADKLEDSEQRRRVLRIISKTLNLTVKSAAKQPSTPPDRTISDEIKPLPPARQTTPTKPQLPADSTGANPDHGPLPNARQITPPNAASSHPKKELPLTNNADGSAGLDTTQAPKIEEKQFSGLFQSTTSKLTDTSQQTQGKKNDSPNDSPNGSPQSAPAPKKPWPKSDQSTNSHIARITQSSIKSKEKPKSGSAPGALRYPGSPLHRHAVAKSKVSTKVRSSAKLGLKSSPTVLVSQPQLRNC